MGSRTSEMTELMETRAGVYEGVGKEDGGKEEIKKLVKLKYRKTERVRELYEGEGKGYGKYEMKTGREEEEKSLHGEEIEEKEKGWRRIRS